MKMRPDSTLALLALLLGLGSGPSVLAAETVAEVQALVNKGQHSQALAMADRVLVANERDPQARFLKGIALTELNRVNEAISLFQKLTEDFPELPEPYNNLAVLYAQQRQYDKARSALEMAIRTHPSYATAHENLGDVYARLASQAYDKALQLDSANAGAQSKLALIREMMSGTYQGSARTRVATTQSVSTPTAPARTTPVAAAPTAPASAVAPAVPSSPPASAVPAAPAAPPVVAASPGTATVTAIAPAASTPTPAATPAAPTPVPDVARSSATPSPDRATAPASVQTRDAAAEREALKVVEAWAAAWSRKDVKTYLSYYDKEFRTPGGAKRKDWERERQQRVGKRGKIAVEIESPDAQVDGDVATVRFRQHYTSAGFDSSAIKTLELVKRNGTWRIRQERVGG
jgi:hypothetical protein